MTCYLFIAIIATESEYLAMFHSSEPIDHAGLRIASVHCAYARSFKNTRDRYEPCPASGDVCLQIYMNVSASIGKKYIRHASRETLKNVTRNIRFIGSDLGNSRVKWYVAFRKRLYNVRNNNINEI